jgi:hypothetical protein
MLDDLGNRMVERIAGLRQSTINTLRGGAARPC